MRRSIQPLEHKSSPYARPNDRWVCGWAQDGHPCAIGPDGKGRCVAHLESSCTPRREGDRYLCNRPMVMGGPCERGPLPDGSCCRPAPRHPPCQPQPSLRARRGKLVAAVMALVVGLLAVGLGSAGWRAELVNPGGLSAAHEPIGALGDGAGNCGACHGSAEGGPAHWLGVALLSNSGQSDSERCLGCHFGGEGRQAALLPHGVPAGTLPAGEPLAPSTMPLMLASMVDAPGAEEDSAGLRCASCHREHRGRHARIAHLGNRQCQTCHAQVYDDFAGNHPEFGSIKRRHSGVQFDHRTHQREHFGERRPFECGSCHRLDDTRRVMLTQGYEGSCAGCHKAGKDDHHGLRIRGASWTLFELPDLDLEPPPPGWPTQNAKGGEITGLMQLLLSGDASSAPALASLAAAGGDPGDWPEGDDEPQLRSSLALAFRRLLDEIAQDDARWLRGQIAAAMKQPVDSEAVDDLYAELRDAADALHASLATLLDSVASSAPVRELAAQLARADAPERLLLQQALAVHCPQLSATGQSPALDALAGAAAGTGPDCLGDNAKPAQTALDDFNALRELIAESLDTDEADAAVAALAEASAHWGRRLEFRIARALNRPLGHEAVQRLARELEGARLALAQWQALLQGSALAPAAATEGAGWALDTKATAIVYRPKAHADTLVHAWIDAAMSAVPAAPGEDATRIVQALRKPASESECVRCHAADPAADQSLRVNWRHAGRDSRTLGFGKFDHSPHVTLFEDGGCDKCHELAATKEEGQRTHGFAVHSKAVCTECHRPGQANSDCLACHEYHLARP